MTTADDARRPYRMVTRAEQHARVRKRILDAMKEAITTKSFTSITLADIAADAGVSVPTVHNHFSSKESLFLAAMEELGPAVLELRGDPGPGDIPAIVRGLVRAYERYGDANWRLLPLQAESPAVADALEAGRAGHRAWLEEVFGPLLPTPPSERRRTIDALYAATDVGTWKLLRRDLGCSVRRTTAALDLLVRGALTGSGEAGQ